MTFCFFAKDSTLELTRSKVKKEILFYDEMFLKFKCLKDLKSNHLILNLLRPFLYIIIECIN
jgi:hypothetical protein